MIDILNHIDDMKKIRKLVIDGMTQDAIKACDVSIAHNQNKVNEFEKWAEEESNKEYAPEGGTVVSDSSDSPFLAHPGALPGEKSE